MSADKPLMRLQAWAQKKHGKDILKRYAERERQRKEAQLSVYDQVKKDLGLT